MKKQDFTLQQLEKGFGNQKDCTIGLSNLSVILRLWP